MFSSLYAACSCWAVSALFALAISCIPGRHAYHKQTFHLKFSDFLYALVFVTLRLTKHHLLLNLICTHELWQVLADVCRAISGLIQTPEAVYSRPGRSPGCIPISNKDRKRGGDYLYRRQLLPYKACEHYPAPPAFAKATPLNLVAEHHLPATKLLSSSTQVFQFRVYDFCLL